MNGRSPNLPSPRFSSSPVRNAQQFNHRQPLYLQPNSYHMSPSPRGGRMPTHGHNSGSPDFIPLGVSSPVNRPRHSWNQRNFSRNSNYSNSPPSSNSSFNFSPYKRNNNFRGNFRGRNSFNNSSNISLYIDKEALEDPWAELEGKLKNQSLNMYSTSQEGDSEVSSAVLDDANDTSSDYLSEGDDS